MKSDKKDAKGTKKGKAAKRKAKKDPNEPPKPVSAYASFFRDTQGTIKNENPDATFGEVSKIVSSLWESLDHQKKKEYKEKADMAKKEYVAALAAYRALKDVSEEPHIIELEPALNDEQEGNSDSCLIASSSSLITLSPPPEKVESTSVTEQKSPIIKPEEKQDEVNAECVELLDIGDDDDDDIIMIKECKNISNSVQESQNEVVEISNTKENKEAGQGDPNMVNGIIPIFEPQLPMCLRSGCRNRAIDSPEWDREYCSSECVIEHCNAVFATHLAARLKRAEENT